MIEAGFIYDGVGRGSMVHRKQEAASIKLRLEEAQLAVSGATPVPRGSSAL
jgi:hypothetical protein